MIAYFVRRLVAALLTIYAVITASFFLVRLMPGNPIEYLEAQMTLEGGMSPEEILARVRAIYGILPTGPLLKQYFQYIGNAFQGNLGESISNPGHSVVSIIAGALPWTVFVISVALLISFVVGIVIGTLMAAFRDTVFSKVMTGITSFLSAIPIYLVAILLLYFFADQHAWFPLGGTYTTGLKVGLNWPFVESAMDHAVLPIASYVIVGFGGWALSMKGSVVTVLGADYVRAAESWGLPTRRLMQSYVGRNSMLPIVTNLALSVGFLFGGAVFVETYFSYPGIGYYLIGAINSRDYSLMMGCFILITVAVIFANLIVDFMYPLIDPRIVMPVRNKRRESAKIEHDVARGPGSGVAVATLGAVPLADKGV